MVVGHEDRPAQPGDGAGGVLHQRHDVLQRCGPRRRRCRTIRLGERDHHADERHRDGLGRHGHTRGTTPTCAVFVGTGGPVAPATVEGEPRARREPLPPARRRKARAVPAVAAHRAARQPRFRHIGRGDPGRAHDGAPERRRLRGNALAAGLALVGSTAVFVLFGSYVVHRLGDRPLERLAAEADGLAVGALPSPAPVYETAELDRLSARYRAMAEDLLDAQSHMVRVEKLAGIGQLAAGVAHEVRNPLGALATYLEVLQRRGADPAVTDEMRGAIERIERIVQGLVDYARPPSRGVQVPGATDLNAAVATVAEFLGRRACSAGTMWPCGSTGGSRGARRPPRARAGGGEPRGQCLPGRAESG